MNNSNFTPNVLIDKPYTLSRDSILAKLSASVSGLSKTEIKSRQEKYGQNILPQAKSPGIFEVFLKQFSSPLIYILIVAAVFSLIIEEVYDAIFISAVLLINATIGTVQEFSAQKAALALRKLVTTKCKVLRDGESYEIDAYDLVPGDIVCLESGDKIPADIRLINTNNFPLGDRLNMAFAGTVVDRGRAQGVVVSTGLHTELGHIASSVLSKVESKAPIVVRMHDFTTKIAMSVGVVALIMAIIAFMQNMPLAQIFLFVVALSVSAIPEGLPVALTVALSIGMHRMAKRNVIVRQLVAVESLGSCTYVCTDKTGTLTENKLTVQKVIFPDCTINDAEQDLSKGITTQYKRLAQCAVLANEGFLGHRDGELISHGDALDVALLKMAHDIDINRQAELSSNPENAVIPFESVNLFSASLNLVNSNKQIFVKGAFEKVISMCDKMSCSDQDSAIDLVLINQQAEELSAHGYRVIALAAGISLIDDTETFDSDCLKNLTFLGLVGIIDPLRTESKASIAACKMAGIKVAMITGDHPSTALAIAKQLDLVNANQKVVTGEDIRKASTEEELNKLVDNVSVFARIEPEQKLDIVKALQRNGHFVAVSGDGANDAPALRAAEVSVAMGKTGTDVAKEASKLIITDNNFASLVAGIQEGRVAYSNVRKVIFLLISTGLAELVLFMFTLISGLPIPLLPVQLLWLNLVTNGIQDIALAFEPAEGNEMLSPPRNPKEPIFKRIMIQRVVVSAVTMAVLAFILFQWLLASGADVVYARNCTLLLMVLFENVQVFNSLSETKTVFKHKIMRNKLLVFGTIAAQLIHIAAMYTPWLNDVLRVSPVSFENWLILLGVAIVLLVVSEVQKITINLYKSIRA